MPESKLFTPYQLGDITLRNRIVMAPMSRSRALDGAGENAPGELMLKYYTQRSSCGLVITEGAPISKQGRGYIYTPGIYRPEQIAGWRRITDSVHDAGAKIWIQLWHTGRKGHSSLREDGSAPVGASTVRSQSVCQILNSEGEIEAVQDGQPRTLETREIKAIVQDYAQAARNAMEAGFDGVQVHAANGYLLDQFLSPYINNERTDEYGGSLENRARLMIEATQAVADAIGPSRVGIRISPLGIVGDMQPDPTPMETYMYLTNQFNGIGIEALDLNDGPGAWIHNPDDELLQAFRKTFNKTLMMCGGFTSDRAHAAVNAGMCDLVDFAKWYISNPDLVERIQQNAPLAPFNPATVFMSGTGEAGYTDFPTLADRNQ